MSACFAFADVRCVLPYKELKEDSEKARGSVPAADCPCGGYFHEMAFGAGFKGLSRGFLDCVLGRAGYSVQGRL